MTNILGESVKAVRKQKHLTQKELSELTGFKQNTISNHENGKRSLNEQDILVYAEALRVTPQDFFDLSKTTKTKPITQPTDHAHATDKIVTAINDKVVQLTTNRKKNVLRFASDELEAQNTVQEPTPVYYTYNYYDQPASAGTGQYLNDVQVEQVELPTKVEADFVIPVYGDSMEPSYYSGDYVFVRLAIELADGDIGVFEYQGEAYIKQLLLKDTGAFLHSLNPSYDDIKIDKDSDFRIIGEVVDVYRSN